MHPVSRDPTLARRQLSRAGAASFSVVACAYSLQYLLLPLVLYFWPGFVDHPWSVWLASSLPMYLGGIPCAWLILRRCAPAPTPVQPFSLKEWACAFAAGYALMMAGNLLGNLLMGSVHAITGVAADNLVVEAVQQSDSMGILLFAVILGPIAEEFLFRGLIFDRLAVFGTGWAVVLTALLFGLFHGNFYQLFYAVGVGLVLSWLKARTGRLRWCIALHMVINFMGSLVPLWLMDSLEAMEQVSQTAMPDPGMLPALFYAAFVLWLVAGGILVLVKHHKTAIALLTPPPRPDLWKLALRAPGMILVFFGSIGAFLLHML